MSPVNVSFGELYPSRWLKAADIPDGKNLILTIQDVTYEAVGQDKEMKLVISFKESTKELVCNKTNAGVLEELFGHDPNGCIGKRIALFATPVTFAGKTTMGVRINPKLPPAPGKPAAQPAQPEPLPPEETEEYWASMGV